MLIRTLTLPLGSIGYDKKEILRYARGSQNDENTLALLDSCLDELGGVVEKGRICSCELPVSICSDRVGLGALDVRSESLAKNLEGCDRAILFAATVGIGIDRLVAKYSAVSPARALIFQAIGAERIEKLCDAFEKHISEDFPDKKLCPRFSPGYGDLDISLQKEIFALLDCPRRIGLTLNNSLLMSPTKSVSAIIGLCSKQK